MQENSDIKQGITKELLRVEEDCIYSSKSHFNSSDFFRKLYYLLGIPLVIVTAVLSKNPNENLILLAFILSSVQTFLNPYKMAENHKIAGDSYLEIRNKIRDLYSYILYKLDDEEAEKSIKCIKENVNKINKMSPIPLGFCFKQAAKGVKKGEAKYEVDKGGI